MKNSRTKILSTLIALLMTGALSSQSLTADFSFVYDTSDCSAKTVHCSDKSSGNLISWHWDFGDSTTSTSPNPSHTYSNTGFGRNFLVTLVVTDTSGASDTTSQNVHAGGYGGARVNGVSTNPATCAGCDGRAIFSVLSKFPPNTIHWTDGSTTLTDTLFNIFPNLCAGTYGFYVTDAQNCYPQNIVNWNFIISDPTIRIQQSAQICEGDVYVLPHGNTADTSGIYLDTFTAANGCDSIITTILIVNSTFSTNWPILLCEHDSLYTDSGWQTTSGTYNITLVSSTGCDSVLVTDLTVIPLVFTSFQDVCTADTNLLGVHPNFNCLQDSSGYIDTTSCPLRQETSCSSGDTLSGVGASIFYAGASPIYDVALLCAKGSCSSVTNVRMEVTFFDMEGFPINADIFIRGQLVGTINISDANVYNNPSIPSNFIKQDTANGGFYSAWEFNSTIWNGMYVDANWYVYYISQGADSNNLRSIRTTISYEYCVEPPGTVTTVDTFVSTLGCDSIVITETTYHPVRSTAAEASICQGNSFFVGGVNQTATGIYNDTLATINGCDSIVTTNLTVFPVYFKADSVVICQDDSFFTGGDFQNAPGTYYDTFATTSSPLPFQGIVLGPGLDCGGTFLVELLGDSTKIFAITGSYFSRIYYADNLPVEFMQEGLQIGLNFRNPMLGEYYPCTALGPAYLHIVVTNAFAGCDSIVATYLAIDSCSVGDVWPGDANSDGIANVWDVLAVATGYNFTGTIRPSASSNWIAQPCPDWVDTFVNGVNYKHADCDGNGLIDSFDIFTISINYGFTHPKTSGTERVIDPDLYFVFQNDTFETGDTIIGTINLGTVINPVTNIYGIAFSIPYDQNYIDSNSFKIDFTNSWLAPPGNRVSLVKDLYTASKIDLGIARSDHNNVSGSGVIANVSFVIQDNIDGKDYFVLPLDLQFDQVLAIASDESPLNITAGGDTLFVVDETVGIESVYNSSELSIFPNPTNGKITIISESALSEFTVVDLLGKEVLHGKLKSGHTEIDMAEFNPGIYLITLKGNKSDLILKWKIFLCR